MKGHHQIPFHRHPLVALLDPFRHPLHEWLSNHCCGDIHYECLVEALGFFWNWHMVDELLAAAEGFEDVVDTEPFIHWAEHALHLILLEVYNKMR
jgi:hypothetical protein